MNEPARTAGACGRPRPALNCPLCGGPNGCAPATSGCFDTPCWCRDVRFTSELLARVPAPQRDIACICVACATAMGKD